ncbi:hypothetical protein CBL_05972 [Carabus blaptoides fortunei]
MSFHEIFRGDRPVSLAGNTGQCALALSSELRPPGELTPSSIRPDNTMVSTCFNPARPAHETSHIPQEIIALLPEATAASRAVLQPTRAHTRTLPELCTTPPARPVLVVNAAMMLDRKVVAGMSWKGEMSSCSGRVINDMLPTGVLDNRYCVH